MSDREKKSLQKLKKKKFASTSPSLNEIQK